MSPVGAKLTFGRRRTVSEMRAPSKLAATSPKKLRNSLLWRDNYPVGPEYFPVDWGRELTQKRLQRSVFWLVATSPSLQFPCKIPC
jgi:hypothetical protein